MRAVSTAIRGSDPNRVTSFESEDRAVPVRPQQVLYTCTACGADQVVPLHPQAAVPPAWPCRCGERAEYLGDAETGEEMRAFDARHAPKPGKSHWDHLRERRTIDELEATLAKRLNDLRSGRLNRGNV